MHPLRSARCADAARCSQSHERCSRAAQVDGLTRRYGERDALSDVSLSLSLGGTLVVFGPNGAGKTTLLRVLATLLRPHAGQRAGARQRAAR